MFQKEFVKKMEKKYPAFKFKVEDAPDADYYRIIVNLDAVGQVDAVKKTFKGRDWDSMGESIIKKVMADFHVVLDMIKKDTSKTVSELVKLKEEEDFPF